jgi:hypothetical protein
MSDQTEEIAAAKGGSKVRGPFMVTCSACGDRYWPEDKEDHLAHDCFPPKFHINDKPAPPPPGGSAGERWRCMKMPRHRKKPKKKQF